MTAMEILTVFALIAGPILSVLIGLWFEQRRTIKGRQLDVFRALMRTRRGALALTPDHVNALNVVEIEFYRSSSVRTTHRELMQHFGSYAANQAWYDRHRSLLAKLLSAMANHLGYKIEQLDMFEGGYAPQGWLQTDEQQLALRLGLLDVLGGKRPLPVQIVQDPPTSISDMVDHHEAK